MKEGTQEVMGYLWHPKRTAARSETGGERILKQSGWDETQREGEKVGQERRKILTQKGVKVRRQV